MSTPGSPTPRRKRRTRHVLVGLAVGVVAVAGATAAHAPPTSGASDMRAINPQPLPPRGGDDLHAAHLLSVITLRPHAYIGETEK